MAPTMAPTVFCTRACSANDAASVTHLLTGFEGYLATVARYGEIRHRALGLLKDFLTVRIIVTTISLMEIEFDPDKRDKTMAERGLDFARAGEVFAGATFDLQDDRFAYGEPRMISFGVLDTRMVVIVWTLRGEMRRIISMRKANEREIAQYAHRVG